MRIVRCTGLALFLVLLAQPLMADPVNLSLGPADGVFVPTTVDQGPPKVKLTKDEEILEYLGLWEDSLSMFYKIDRDGMKESGSYASSYATVSLTGTSATIEFAAGDYIVGDPLYLVVKNGNHGHYVFDLLDLGWDGQGDLILSELYPTGKGSVSHISIWGSAATSVPEPGTLTLLGLGLVAAGIASRRRR